VLVGIFYNPAHYALLSLAWASGSMLFRSRSGGVGGPRGGHRHRRGPRVRRSM